MSQNSFQESAIKTEINVRQLERWQIYQRLIELQVPCRCSCNQPLQVNLNTPLELWQFWSVVQRVGANRQTLASRLERCWQIPSYKRK